MIGKHAKFSNTIRLIFMSCSQQMLKKRPNAPRKQLVRRVEIMQIKQCEAPRNSRCAVGTMRINFAYFLTTNVAAFCCHHKL